MQSFVHSVDLPQRPPNLRPYLATALSVTCCAVFIFIAGCATPSSLRPYQGESLTDTTTCSRFLQHINHVVASAKVQDRQALPVASYPFLRVNRLLASFAEPTLSPVAMVDWINAMARLSITGRHIELSNLPPTSYTQLQATLPPSNTIKAAINQCTQLLSQQLITNPAQHNHLRQHTKVPDNYSLTQRIFGIYPLTALGIAVGVSSLHKQTREVFDTPYDKLPINGTLQVYSPTFDLAITTGYPTHLDDTDHLGIPKLTPRQQTALFARHAPILSIDVATEDDRIGTPVWETLEHPHINTHHPVLYQQVSYTRLEGRVHLQLNYIFWFAARTATGPLDIYAGRLDGMMWRVTLNREAQPIIYESVHNCGCYHKFYPTTKLATKPTIEDGLEPVFIAQQIPTIQPNEKLLLRISNGEHHVLRIKKVILSDIINDSPIFYTMQSYDKLRSLPTSSGQHKSLFATTGLVSGTERPERWILWPMGVASAGAMRQWGHHAIAFIGKRHFDDPFLIDQYFTPILH